MITVSIDGVLRELLRDELREIRQELRDLRSEIGKQQSTGARPGESAEYLSTTAAAKLAKVQPATIRRWINQGKLARYGTGRILRIRLQELRELLAEGDGAEAEIVDLDAQARRILDRRRAR